MNKPNKALSTLLSKLYEARQELSGETVEATKVEEQVEAKPEGDKATEEVSLAEAKVNGVTIEAESFEVGQPVFAVSEEGERVPLGAGDYTTEEGNMFSVDEAGVITSIGEPSENPEMQEEQEMSQEAEQPAKKVIESQTVSKETFFSEIEKLKTELKAEFAKELEAKDAEIEKLKTELSATPSEVHTKVAPTEKPTVKPKLSRAAGVGNTVQDRVSANLSHLWNK